MDFVALSSSRGTTFQAVLDRRADGSLGARCLGLVTDRADRGCAEKARAADVPVTVVERREHETRETYDERLSRAVLSLGGDPLVAAMGWMTILSPAFVRRHRVINVHPALLPQHGGKGMYGDRVHAAVLESGDAETGITLHLMDEGVDTGPVLLQKRCPVLPGDTVETLKERVQSLEREWYPRLLEMLRTGEVALPRGGT